MTDRLSTSSNQYLKLFLASLLALFFEMLIVRWLAAEIRLFSYFKNVTLMAAFIGLALGFALAKKPQDHLSWFGPLLLIMVPLVLVVSFQTGYRALIIPEDGEYIWRTAALPSTVSSIIFVLLLGLFFTLTLMLFIPLGQLTGRQMLGLRPLNAYIVNLIGSLAGIWAFAATSHLTQPPWVWFALGLILLLFFTMHSRRIMITNMVSVGLVTVVLGVTQGSTIWSPYYRIDVLPLEIEDSVAESGEQIGYELFVNQIGHMFALNLNPDRVAQEAVDSTIAKFAALYNVPYSFSQPSSVLVVGAGMGNDVAAALRHDVERIDAVEIDPAIYSLGQDLHPERPYQEPQVVAIVDDARAFLERTDQRYEMIVFGILDSQTLLSGMSSVRLDNYIYTEESLQAARDLLTDDGVLALTFDVERSWIKERLAATLTKVFGGPPVQLSITDTPWTIYIAGPGVAAVDLESLCGSGACIADSIQSSTSVPLATDDWPYLYLEDRSIPTPYILAILVVVLISWLAARKVYTDVRQVSAVFFLLGAAFMLIEFRIITELALLFGSTWIVNAIAVSAVLLMVLLANILVATLGRISINYLFVGLLATMSLGYITPLRTLLPLELPLRMLAAQLLMGLPVFFSAAIFAVLLRELGDVTSALSSNLLGSALGGMLEYGSLAFGIGSLYILGGLLYAVTWVLYLRQNPPTSEFWLRLRYSI